MESSSSAADGWKPTISQEDQWTLESQVFHIYRMLCDIPPKSQAAMLELQRDSHVEYLEKGLRHLGPSFSVLDANRPWICYWILHSIALLGESVDVALENNVIDFISRCQDQHGGYGGGPGQMPHLATTYAAVNTLITLGGNKSLKSINRGKIYSFLRRMKHTSGGFSMHEGGEIDVRACYTAISVASVLSIIDEELVRGVGDYIVSCQTYEGGIAGEPGSEAHGGYTFCGLATMILINAVNHLDLASLTDWLVFRQGVEGGFQGRTNKLVDGCYSFWQGGAAALLQRLHAPAPAGSISSDLSDDGGSPDQEEGSEKHSDDEVSIPIRRHTETEPLFQSQALQQYILLCSQVEGGFRDKPGKSRDHYHTCYCLSGLAVAQYSWSNDADSVPLPGSVLGPYSNLLEPVNPLYNIVVDQYNEAHEFFSNAPALKHE
ncbi:protein farnesyltransferase subunit beta-like [Bidens hawaiensis]|uniref:protein farnesyltransferase subunit beta-like n=1 Tax=Bidens hawaiensis TaxID=980011 RepID=UPI00404A8EF7